MVELVEQVHESCSISVLDGTEIVYVARVPTAARIMSINLGIGTRLPAFATSIGKTFPAFVAEGGRFGYFVQPLRSIYLTSHLTTELRPNGDLRTVLNNFLTKQERKPNNSAPHARFTAPQFADCMLPGEKLSRQERSDLTDLLTDCGAKSIGQARVNTPSGDVMKDRVYEVEKDNYEPFIDLILSKV